MNQNLLLYIFSITCVITWHHITAAEAGSPVLRMYLPHSNHLPYLPDVGGKFMNGHPLCLSAHKKYLINTCQIMSVCLSNWEQRQRWREREKILFEEASLNIAFETERWREISQGRLGSRYSKWGGRGGGSTKGIWGLGNVVQIGWRSGNMMGEASQQHGGFWKLCPSAGAASAWLWKSAALSKDKQR